MVIIYKMCFDFLYNLFQNISHSKESSARYDQKFVWIFMKNIRYFCQIFMKLEFSQQSFMKYSNIKFH